MLAQAETEHLNPWVKAAMILLVLCLFLPVLWNILKSTAFNQRQRQYERTRAAAIRHREKHGGMGHRRYNRLWVVDRDLDENPSIRPRQDDSS
jgi:hypothetical protein